jgi:hypothetical protein
MSRQAGTVKGHGAFAPALPGVHHGCMNASSFTSPTFPDGRLDPAGLAAFCAELAEAVQALQRGDVDRAGPLRVDWVNGTPLHSITPPVPILTTKGDLLTYSTQEVRLPVGADGTVVTADSTQPDGIKWAVPSLPGGLTPTPASRSIPRASSRR